MAAELSAFPERATLWRGAILGTIAHAIWVAAGASLTVLQQWDGLNYSLNDVSGARGTVTFTPERVVAAFRDEHHLSRAAPPLQGIGRYAAEYYFAGAPDAAVALAREEALQYLFDTYRGVDQPVATAAFWSEGETLRAIEPWAAVVEHGAHLLRIQLLPADEAVSAWEEDYELSAAQVALLRAIFERRMATPDGIVALTPQERRALAAVGEEGIEESRALLAAVGIALP
jgi:hypothetical protein